MRPSSGRNTATDAPFPHATMIFTFNNALPASARELVGALVWDTIHPFETRIPFASVGPAICWSEPTENERVFRHGRHVYLIIGRTMIDVMVVQTQRPKHSSLNTALS